MFNKLFKSIKISFITIIVLFTTSLLAGFSFLIFYLSHIDFTKFLNGEIKGITDQSITEDDSISSDYYKVIDVIDGDTIKIDYKGKEQKVRLIGIDSPERGDCFNTESTNKLKELAEGKYVNIEFDITQGNLDKYDRLLLYIWIDDQLVNEIMIQEGYAFEYTYNIPYKYWNLFIQAEKSARENKKGLWGNICSYN